VVVAIDGRPIANFTDLQRIVSVSTGEGLTVEVERGAERVTLHATPELKEIKDPFGNASRVGILGINRSPTADQVVTERFSVPEAFVRALQETWFIVERTVSYLAELVIGKASVDQLGGPVKVAEISGQVATLGFIPLLSLAATLSISIGLINLFPIPVLDGGHLLFYLIEAVRGRPLSETAQEIGFRFGFAALLALMVFTVLQDTGILARLAQFWT
jgi:regulator of sigma E protease